jgi:hypothetical protein
MDDQRLQWPDLVGKDAEEAKAIIEKERPELNVVVSAGRWVLGTKGAAQAQRMEGQHMCRPARAAPRRAAL